MNIIVEGLDSTGKSSLILNLQNYFYDGEVSEPTPVQILYYTNFKAATCNQKKISYAHYEAGFKTLRYNASDNRHLIFDRFHLGEFVYSPLYRNYNGDYVFELEKKYMDFLSGTLLIVLIDDAENLIERDDGLSFSIDINQKKEEIKQFKKGYELSNLNKMLINVKDKTIADVANIVIKKLRKMRK